MKLITDVSELTPVERHGQYWMKRDDLFNCNGARGGKARTFARLMVASLLDVRFTSFQSETVLEGVVTYASRVSPQQNYPALIAELFKIGCRVHIPEGETTPETLHAMEHGAVIVTHRPGYLNNLERYSRDDASERGWLWIPFGLEGHDAVRFTSFQVASLLDVPFRHSTDAGPQRIVIPVGSGLSAAGILWGLARYKITIPVVGVKVGKDPVKCLDKWAPTRWKDMMKLVPALEPYHVAVADPVLEGVRLDSHYEAKCLPYILPGDLLWIVGIRPTEVDA